MNEMRTEETDAAAPGPRRLSHVGITVTDLDAAVAWYQEVLGFELLSGPDALMADDSDGGVGAAKVFGPRFRRARAAHLCTGDGVGVELFQFAEPATELRPDTFEYWKTGVSHICVLAPDIERVAARIAATGGRVRVPVREVVPGGPYRWCYCEDPFGVVVELWSHRHEEVFAHTHAHEQERS